MKNISIIIPCYNEEDNLQLLYSGLKPVLENIKMSYDIWFIDDGSTDSTLKVLEKLTKKDYRVHYISFSRNFGHQKALKAGLDFAEGQAVIMMDADLQHPVSLIPQFIEKWKEGYQVVNTIRHYNHSWGIGKQITSRLFYHFINLISDVEITPYSPDFRLLDKKVVNVLKTCNEEYLFLRGMVNWCGFKHTNIYFQDGDRHAGASKYTWGKMLSLTACAATAFSVRPLKTAIAFAGIFFLCFLFMLVYVGYTALYTQHSVPGWASLAVLISLQGSMTMLMLGIIGEYIGKSFMQGKSRPAYIVKQTSEEK